MNRVKDGGDPPAAELPGPAAMAGQEPRGRGGRRARPAGAGGSVLLVLGSLVALVLQSRLGGKEDFPPGPA